LDLRIKEVADLGKITNIQKEKELIGSFLLSREAINLAVDNNFLASEFTDIFNQEVLESILQKCRIDGDFLPTTEYIIDQLKLIGKEADEARIKINRYKKMVQREIVKDRQILDITQENMAILKDLSLKRKVINVLRKGIENIDISAREFISSINKELISIEINDGQVTELHIQDGLLEIKKDMEYQMKHGVEYGYKTHFRDIDIMLDDNITKGSLTYILGRPSNYKTGLALNLMVNMAKAGTPNAMFSHEMSPKNCYRRILSRLTGIEMKKLKKPSTLTQEEWAKLDVAIKEVETWPLYILDGSKLNIGEIDSAIAYLKGKYNIEVIWWDYFQLIRKRDNTIPSDESDFGEISEELRMFAKRYDIAAISLSQANRGCEMRDDKRPTMKDIRNTGKAEQDAENILYVYRDEFYYLSQSEMPNHLEVGALKVREGELKRVLLHFNGAKATLGNCDPLIVMDKSRDYIGGGGTV
jgi:replicative DNA helicase